MRGLPAAARGYTLTLAGEEMVALAQRVDEDITAFTRRIAGREPSPFRS
jgi:hypothetical protein